MIICVEGADNSGKTTLCKHLVNQHGARYMHARVWKEMVRWHSGIMRYAIKLHERGELVVLDRHWISEFIYGPVFRHKPAYGNALAQDFDELILMRGCYVLCIPSDLQGQLARHRQRVEKGKEMFQQIERVVQYYADLAKGNVAHPGPTYLDELIRFGDFITRGGAVVYDIDRDTSGEQVHFFCKKLVKGDYL